MYILLVMSENQTETIRSPNFADKALSAIFSFMAMKGTLSTIQITNDANLPVWLSVGFGLAATALTVPLVYSASKRGLAQMGLFHK